MTARPRLDGWGLTACLLAAAGGLLGGFVLGLLTYASWGIVIGLALGAAAVASAITYTAQLARIRRQQAFQALCDQQGWALARDDAGMPDLLRSCLPYRRGHSVAAGIVLLGARDGLALRVVDGRYTTGSGKHQTRHVVSSVALEMPFPLQLTIEAEGFGHKLVDALGGEDIDVESDEFSRRFWVQSPDRRKAYDVLHAGMIEFLLGVGTQMTWHWNDRWLVLTWTGRLEPEDCVPNVAKAVEFRKRLPRHLLAAARPGAGTLKT